MRGGVSQRQRLSGRARLDIALLPLGKAPEAWLPSLAARLEAGLACRTSQVSDWLDFGFAFLPARGQFSSTSILLHLRGLFFRDSSAAAVPADDAESGGWRAAEGDAPSRIVLAVADVDLCVPIFTFVFGEAIDNGPCAIVSGYRLRQEFYGLPPDPELFEERLLKMATHEIGHTQGLRHCAAYGCVMATSYAIERVDLKSVEFCPSCARAFYAPPSARATRLVEPTGSGACGAPR